MVWTGARAHTELRHPSLYLLVEGLVARFLDAIPGPGPIWAQYLLYGLILGEATRRGKSVRALVAVGVKIDVA